MTEIFPKMAGDFHKAAGKITVEQLLAHTAGLSSNPAFQDWQKSRMEVTKIALKEKPSAGFAYSNLGYIVAGTVIEKVSGKTWEEALKEEVFAPLGIKNFGFGPPVGEKAIRGHSHGSPAPVGVGGDNTPLFGPAGRVHLSLQDWVLFAQDQIAGAGGSGKLLKKENYLKLHTPVSPDYALGWGVTMSAGKPVELRHDGSNTLWYARIILDLNNRKGSLVVANSADENAQKWINRVTHACKEGDR